MLTCRLHQPPPRPIARQSVVQSRLLPPPCPLVVCVLYLVLCFFWVYIYVFLLVNCCSVLPPEGKPAGGVVDRCLCCGCFCILLSSPGFSTVSIWSALVPKGFPPPQSSELRWPLAFYLGLRYQSHPIFLANTSFFYIPCSVQWMLHPPCRVHRLFHTIFLWNS